jgi:hypothetical protein
MSQDFRQPDLFDNSTGGTPEIYQMSGRTYFSDQGFTGTLGYGWYADGETSPWLSADENAAKVEGHAPYPSDPPDDEFDGTPDWLVEQIRLGKRHLGDAALEAEQILIDESGIGDAEPQVQIGPDDVLDQQRTRRVVMINFDPRSAGLHRHVLRWVYWENCEGVLTPEHTRSVVALAIRSLIAVEGMSAAARGGANKYGTGGLKAVD